MRNTQMLQPYMTRTRRSAALAVLCLTTLAAACSDARQFGGLPTSPTSQTPPTPTQSPVVRLGTLSGVVFEKTSAGHAAPVEGVEVYCDACGGGHVATYTDSSGAYSFTEVKTAVYPLWVAKRGYNLVKPTASVGAGWMGSINVQVDGDTRFDIEVIQQ
jgi:hypothetical protein